MNTVVKAIPGYYQEDLLTASPFGSLSALLTNKKLWSVVILLVLIFISSLSVVYVQAQNRILYSQLSALENQRDRLRVEWGQLLLEQSTWSTQSRIEKIAEKQLHMLMPQQKDIIILQ